MKFGHSEEKLLAKARRFDQKALGEIYDLFSPELYRYAYRLLGNQQLAEDCVAETFRRFLQALKGGGGPRDHLRAYLFRVAHNWATDYYRRRGPQLVAIEDSPPLISSENPARALDDKEAQAQVREALHKLTPEQQQVIMLKFYEGWSNEEVAQSLKKTVGAVKALQHRGLVTLRRLVNAAQLSTERE